MLDCERLAALIFGDVEKTPDDYENLYPPRKTGEGGKITRIAPSPTGYLHLGVLYVALINKRTAYSSKGVFYTRIEDTDKKREIEGGFEDIINGLVNFGIEIDEGFVTPKNQKGEYGPYRQSERREIYRCYAKYLMGRGLAYPCFCTPEELEQIRKKQEELKITPGYYGEWTKHRDISYEEAKEKIEAGIPFTIRLKSPGTEDGKVIFTDEIKGKIEMPENNQDIVLLKTDGIPTYHFAHAVDDHLMRTTHVIRGDEWISSTPVHLQLFKLLGFKPAKYAHVAPIMKGEDGGKRKISKRKDPEAAVKFFAEQGYPRESIIEYLLTLANSDYEDWRRLNPGADCNEFKFNIKKMSVSGALFDSLKLDDVSKNVISRMNSEETVSKIVSWAKEHNTNFYELLSRDIEYAENIFKIDRGGKKPRKDISKWMEAENYSSYFYDELFNNDFELPENMNRNDAVNILKEYKDLYEPDDEQSIWFEKVKKVCENTGFAADMKDFKKSPEKYKGNVSDAAAVIRIAVTGRANSPDLCSVMKIIGKERCINRIDKAIKKLEN